MKLLVLLLIAFFCNSQILDEGEENMREITVETWKPEREIIIMSIKGDKIKLVIESLDNDYEVKYDCNTEKEECEWEIDGKKSILTYYEEYTEIATFKLKFTIKQNTKFKIYYYKPTNAGLVILYIFIAIGVLVGLYFCYRVIRAYKRIEDEKKRALWAKEEAEEEKIKQFAKFAVKNPSYINRICPVCLKDKDGQEFPDEDSIALNESDDTDIEIENHKKKLIEAINNDSIDYLIPYVKVKKCEHFFHEKCKKAENNQWYKRYYKHECLYCKNWMNLKNLKAFAKISEKSLQKIIESYHFEFHYPDWDYPSELRKKFFHFIYNCEEIPEEKREAIKTRRKIAIKFINDLEYDVDFEILSNDFKYWENRYEEELSDKKERIAKNQAKEREIQAKRDNIVTLHCCNGCTKTCCLCGKRDSVLEGAKAHKTCLLFEGMCVICKQKTTDINPFCGFCFFCKNKYHVQNNVHCAVCRQPLM